MIHTLYNHYVITNFQSYKLVTCIVIDRPQLFKKPVLIMGADVTHPSPADKRSPSIAAVSTYNIIMIMILQY